MKFFICLVFILSMELFPQSNEVNSFAYSALDIVNISGTVMDENNNPLPSVNVSLPALHRGTITGIDGKFIIEGIHSGIYKVEFSLLGYKKETRSVTIINNDVSIDIILYQSALELPGIIVIGKPQPTDILSSSQSVSAVDGRELTRLRGQTVMQALEYTPGVSTFTTGIGVTKPVIRGLTSQRVLVVSDGIRQEGQQWGDEHGPEIDAFDVERIEVLRGPSSVLYGSDALGGVVNIIKHDLPSVNEGSPKLGGSLILNGFSNNDHAAGDLSLYGAAGGIGYRGHFSIRNANDISTPAGKLFNSGLKEISGGGLLGAKGAWGAASLDYSYFNQELQIHEDPAEEPDATPFQKILHGKAHFHSDFPMEKIRLEVDGSWQNNIRREFEEENAVDPVLNLHLNTFTLDLKGHHQPIGSTFGTVGFSIMSQKNESLAEEKLIPGFNLFNAAGFIFEESQLGSFNLSAGFRYDFRKLKVEQSEELNVDEQTRNYNALSGTVGLVYRLSEPIALALNIGRGWRAPTPFELFVDGIHEGTVRYEVGEANLKNESSLNVDFSLRYVSNKLQSEITIFQNKIQDYIYLSPSGVIDSTSGFPIYLHKQANASLIGAEFSLRSQITDWLIINSGYNYVKGTNDKTDNPLPLIPAISFRIGAKLTTFSILGILNPYISADAKIVSSQTRIEEFETQTGGYTLFNAGIGGDILINSERASFDLSIENIFNKTYREHLNRYKEYALNPGRNIKFELTIPFTFAK